VLVQGGWIRGRLGRPILLHLSGLRLGLVGVVGVVGVRVLVWVGLSLVGIVVVFVIM